MKSEKTAKQYWNRLQGLSFKANKHIKNKKNKKNYFLCNFGKCYFTKITSSMGWAHRKKSLCDNKHQQRINNYTNAIKNGEYIFIAVFLQS